jgi:HD-GYP domain-containing protein (c-di-GMP phosphodiesterase class II)
MRHQSLVFKRMGEIRRSEIMVGFSYALDLTEGQPQGHAIRTCFIAASLARQLGLDPAARGRVYYTALLKDLGGSGNAAAIHRLYGADDLAFKPAWRRLAPGRGAALRFVVEQMAPGMPLARRAAALARALATGCPVAREVVEARSTRGAELARELRFGEGVAQGIARVDEHWDGSGLPEGLVGEAIPRASRIALLAQVAEVFHQSSGRRIAAEEVVRRAGTWLDPGLVRAFVRLADEPRFWTQLESSAIDVCVAAMAPEDSGYPRGSP